MLNNFATKIVAENSFIKASFGGFAGSGKTRTATEFIIGCYKEMNLQKPILFIDNEKGSRFLIPLFKASKIEVYIKETVELSDVLYAIRLLKNGEFDFLFIDSLTKVWYKYVRDYKDKNKKTFMTLQDWGKILPAWQETFADTFVNVPGNCVFTGRGGYTYDAEENDRGKMEFVKSGVKMKMAGETPFETDLNIWMNIAQEMDSNEKPKVTREALILKDRSGLIDGKTFTNPVFNDFKPIIEFLTSVEKGEVAKFTNNENLAPHEEYDDKKRQKEIYLDKIKAEFEKRQFSQTKEDKQLKVLIAEKCFDSSSWTQIENFRLDQIIRGYNNLLNLFATYDKAENRLETINNFTGE
jgi:hypothetical protein